MLGNPYNDAAIIRGGMSLVPDLRQQLIEDALFKQQQTVFQQQQDDRVLQQRQLAESQAKEAEFQAALEDAMLTGDPRKIRALQLRFPEFTKGMKDAFDGLDRDARQADLTQIGSIFANLNAGNTGRAVETLRRRIEADRAAGQDTTDDEQILAEIESGDPARINAAKATVGIMLASVEPDKFAEVYGKVNPTEAVPATIREYDARVAKFGKPAADAWLATQDTKLVPVQPGGTVFSLGGNAVPQQGVAPAAQGGGDPSGSGVEGLTPEQFRANVQVLGPQRAAAMTAKNGIPVRVRSVQEANALPPGTLYSTPTGELYTR